MSLTVASDSNLSLRDIISDFEEFNSAIDVVEDQDAEMVDLARTLLDCINTLSSSCYSSIPVDAKVKIIKSITNFKVLMTPNTGLVFRCCSCCVKKKRQRQHVKKCALTSIEIVEATFISQAYSIEYKCDMLIHEYIQSRKYADTLQEISSTTSIFEIENNIKSKATAKESLSILLSRIELYKNEFVNAKGGEASSKSSPTRFRNIKVSLASNPSTSTSYVNYKKANKMLHDVATLGTSLLLYKVDEKLKEIDQLIKMLQKSLAREMSYVDSIEVSPHIGHLVGETKILQIKNYSEDLESTIQEKLVEASSEWSVLKERVSSSSFLSTFFGSADDDIENLFSSSLTVNPSVGSNVDPIERSNSKSPTKSSNVADFFNNIRLPSNKPPSNDASEPPIYNLRTKQIATENNPTSTVVRQNKKYLSADFLPSETPSTSNATRSEKRVVERSLPSKLASEIEKPVAKEDDSVQPPLSLDVIDFDDVPSEVSSSPLLNDTSTRPFLHRTAMRSGKGDNNKKSNNSIFSSKFNSKINKMSGSLSRTASKASAIASETREKVSGRVASAGTRRILKNSYTSLKKSEL